MTYHVVLQPALLKISKLTDSIQGSIQEEQKDSHVSFINRC